MILVPYPLRMEAKGQFLPVEIAQIFPPRRGASASRSAASRARRSARTRPSAMLYSPTLSKNYRRCPGPVRPGQRQVPESLPGRSIGSGATDPQTARQLEIEMPTPHVGDGRPPSRSAQTLIRRLQHGPEPARVLLRSDAEQVRAPTSTGPSANRAGRCSTTTAART